MTEAEQAIAAGDGPAAIAHLQALLDADPDNVDGLAMMARLAHAAGRNDAACGLMERVVDLDPANAKMHYSLGALLQTQGRDEEAVERLDRALQMDPALAEAAVALGNIARAHGRWSDAAAHYETALSLRPSLSEVETNLGAVRLAQGFQREAIRHHNRAIALKPGFDLARHNRLLSLHYADDVTPDDLFEAHRRWGVERAAAIDPLPPVRPDDPDRPLRLGFVSPDFNNHPVSQFFLSFLQGRDGSNTTVTLYSSSEKKDQVTKALMESCETWVQVERMSDRDLALRVREDGIDILVDLAGHTAGTRLLAFAWRPAPVQATWIGYPDTTGLASIDWRLTDAVADPPGEADGRAVEKLYRVPDGFLCYRPADDAPPVSRITPGQERQFTFASLNNLSKVTDTAIRTWSEILNRAPGSRLLIKARSLNDDATCVRLEQRFSACGVDAGRLDIRRHVVGMAAHLDTYNLVDIALDTFPYNGTTTTCDALWMGVPVVCMAGDRHSARVSASLLSRLGLEDWIAGSPRDYVGIAVSAFSNREQLVKLQNSLRDRMAASPLLDGKGFACRMETAFRAMWRDACTRRL